VTGPANELSVLAEALAKLARAAALAGRPFDLWIPPLTDISSVTDRVAQGAAAAIWMDETDPEQGLLIYAPSPGETLFFGYGCARLMGPYLPPKDQERRESASARLAGLAAARARVRGDRLVTINTGLDPAVLRGFIAAGFTLAEVAATLICELPGPTENPAALPPGFAWLERDRVRGEAAALVEVLGDFFYDGHLRHDPKPGPEAARLIWRQTALGDLSGAADEAVALWDCGRNRGAGLATARLTGREAGLSILALAEPYRGRGLGRPLLGELKSRLEGRANLLRAETAAYNLPALALYQALGFKPGPPLAVFHLHLSKTAL
jgi:ribosomal protein S18 acetylase RimI-like enzyme